MRTRRLVTALEVSAAAAAAGFLIAAARPRPHHPEARPPEPPPELPPARIVHVPGRGEMFIREAPGPAADSPTVLLLHGWMFPADLNWYTSYGPLSEVARVIAPDHRGHGRGMRPSTPFRLTDVADDVAALVHHLGAGPIVAVGYSMGGPVAQLLWQRHPEVVRGLVLCATSDTFNDTRWESWRWKLIGALQVFLRVLPRAWMERGARMQASGALPVEITRMLRSDTPDEIRDLLPWVISELDRGSAEDVAEAGRELSRFDSRGWLQSLDVPTAAIVTTEDRLVPPFRQRAMAARVADCAVYEVPLDHDAPAYDLFPRTLVKALEPMLAPDRIR
jgi:pimeloyl-ACP methyl ester carboxylesterase